MPELDEEPLNREPPLADLISSFITTKDGYDRNHGAIPHLDASTHHVRVDGAVENILDLSISELQANYTQHTVVCALQCAGNRRHTMRTQLKEVQGIDWFDGAVMNCKWRGPRLRDILQHAKPTLPSNTKGHVAMACYATPCQDDTWYGASIELSRALREDADVILALEMNDEPLTPEHGYPVRVVTPGIAGARAVKWLDKITVQEQESPNFYQQHDYKILPPQAVDKESAEEYWHKTPAIQDMPVNSVVAVPESGSKVERTKEGCVEVKGYALPSGEDGPVTRVEVSGDGGESWVDAELIEHPDDGKWAWKLWEATVKIEQGTEKIIFSRATDKAGNTQVKQPEWNLRGVSYNGYGDARDLHVV